MSKKGRSPKTPPAAPLVRTNERMKKENGESRGRKKKLSWDGDVRAADSQERVKQP